MSEWFQQPFHQRALSTEEWFGHTYRAGEFLPFYVPRPVMPQIDEENYEVFMQFALSKRVGIGKLYLSPQLVRAHQRLDRFKAYDMPVTVLNKPVLISLDMFVLDGNHRWLAHVMRNRPMWCLQINLPFEEAIAFMFSFPKTYDLETHPEGN